jgi:hypothetical protein
MPPAPYTRILLNGIPYWRDNADGKLYYYESAALPTPETRICLGTEATGLCADWQTLLAGPLELYRASLAPRERARATPTGTK